MPDRRFFSLLLVLLVCTGSSLLLVACGDDDGSSSSSDAPKQSGGTEQPGDVASSAYGDLAAEDFTAVCDRMTMAAQAQLGQVAAQSGGSGEKRSCEDLLEEHLGGAELDVLAQAQVGEADVSGMNATVELGFDTGSVRVPLQKIEGQWSLAEAPALPSESP